MNNLPPSSRRHTYRRESAPHFKGPAAMKRGLFCRHRRRLRAALALPAAALLLYSCDPPASPLSASREVSRVETKKDGSTITTTLTAEGGELVVTKGPDGREVSRVETRSDKSTITTTPTPGGGITRELVIHSSVTKIEDYAFRNNHLTSLTIGNGVQTIGAGAFAENPKLKTVRITGTGPVESNAFTHMHTSVSHVRIFNESSSSGIELIIEDGITAIGDYAFAYNLLTSVTIPPSVTAIGRGAFSYNKLTSLTIPPSVTKVGRGAFYDNLLTSVTIPPSVTKVGDYAFSRNKLTSVNIRNGVKTIGVGAFTSNQLTSLRIPSSVTAIGPRAFWDNKLTSVILPKALYNARGDAFDGNPADLQFRDHKGDSLGTN